MLDFLMSYASEIFIFLYYYLLYVQPIFGNGFIVFSTSRFHSLVFRELELSPTEFDVRH